MRIPPYIRRILLTSILGTMIGVPTVASGQSLVEMYRSARFRAQAQEILRAEGARVRPLPPAPLPYVSDSVRASMEALFPMPDVDTAEPAVPSVRIRKVSLTPKLARGWFQETFADTRWSYYGSNDVTATDTTYTREVRARLEAAYGSPTRTIADDLDTRDGEFIQFEYWFVLNDSIPLNVMDVNGPFERGVVVATDQKYRDLLPDLKQALLGPVLAAGERGAYVDYYYLREQGMWFVTGFDGERFFLERISRPDLKLGRPLLERVRSR